MFDDYTWCSQRFALQQTRYHDWLHDIRGSDLVVIEIGAGTSVPTIRQESERRPGTLIRINPREHDTPRGQLSIPLGAAEAIERLNVRLTS